MVAFFTMFIADQKGTDARKDKVENTDGDDLNMSLKCLHLIDREDLDFTEQLWEILRGLRIM